MIMTLMNAGDAEPIDYSLSAQSPIRTNSVLSANSFAAVDQPVRTIFFDDEGELTTNVANIFDAKSGARSHHTVTVVVPAYNAAATLGDCLKAIRESSHPIDELIVYIDGATDCTELIARSAGATVLVNSGKPKGPGGGRNEAAVSASSEYVLFVDADVIIEPKSLELLLADIDSNGAAAAFGSYDTSPRSTRVASFYANLRHHHFHQHSSRDASTFWTGMGLIRRDIFLDSGGFDIEKYRHPSIEDVELGMRIVSDGHRIRLVPEALSKHCKDWTIQNVWHTDIVRRAYPWSRLLIDGIGEAVDLNLGRTERFIALLAVAIMGLLVLSLLKPALLLAALALFGLYIYLNKSFFALLFRVLKFPKMIGAVAMHFCYHLYSTATFAYTMAEMRFGRGYQDRAVQARNSLQGAPITRPVPPSM